jgi:hypothetical protein
MSKLETRLARQLAAKGVSGAKSMARSLLVKRGQEDAAGNLTAKGKARQDLGNAGRAKDRASRASGHDAADYTYNASTNAARLKK